MKVKKTPLRTCVGCGLIRPKCELARVIFEDGKVTLDVSGKKQGRGAYICRIETEIEQVRQGLPRHADTVCTVNAACKTQAVENGGFQRAFKQKITEIGV
jgi:uncharacterized protein